MSDERGTTIRQAIIAALRDEPLSARELSQRVGVKEREIAAHLMHIERSLASTEQELKTLPARCVQCAFAFTDRDRKSRPSRCPKCKSERMLATRFVIEAKP